LFAKETVIGKKTATVSACVQRSLSEDVQEESLARTGIDLEERI
jgi:hypothetical protein